MKSNYQSNGLRYVTSLLVCCSLIAAQSQITPASIKMKVFEDDTVCTPDSIQHSQIQNEVDKILNSSILPQLYGLNNHIPAASCADIYQGHPSGYYWLNVADEPQLVYCSLNENCCSYNDGDGKWMRIAYLNMSDPSVQCPDGWREVLSPIRTCRRQFNTSINSVNYTSYGIPYSRVCGRIIAYQLGTPEGFLGYVIQNQDTIDDTYVDGISITFGHPRNHIWTFAAAKLTAPYCPCIESRNPAPPFVNDDYFCEVGVPDAGINFTDSNPLWDGQGCAGSSACCEFNNPPWFCKQLPQPTTEDIEIRLLSYVVGDYSLENEDTPVKLIEIYVQ